MRLHHTLRSAAVSIILMSFLSGAHVSVGQDLVGSSTITGGASAFVFRNSAKKPQARMGGSSAFIGAEAGRGVRSKQTAGKFTATAKRKRTSRKKAPTSAANRKIALSNSLAAKADKFLESDDVEQAISNYRAALVQNPKNQHAVEGLSDALTEKGILVAGEANDPVAVKFLDEAIRLDPQNDAAYAKLADIHQTNGKTAEAVKNYEKAIAIDAGLVELHAPLGLAYIDLGEIAKAVDSLEEADRGGVDTLESRFLRGLVSLKQNKNAQAVAAFDRVLELDARNVNARYYRGQALMRLDQQDQAIAELRRTLEISPGFTPASYDLGVTYYNSGNYDAAATAYEQTIAHDNDNAQAHANLASTYRQLERYSDANSQYSIAAQKIDRDPDLYSEWGYCLGKVNDWDKAAARLLTARELSPMAIDSSNLGWAYYNSAAVKTEAKDVTGARADLEIGKAFLVKAVELDPKLDAAYLNLGSTYNSLGEFQLAVNALNTVIGLRPNWQIALNQLGLGYRGLGNFANAIATFKRVVDLDGNYKFGLFNLGEAYHASGNKKEAKKINDQLRRLDPTMASTLDNIFSGKAVVDDAKKKVEKKLPRIPKLPY